MFLTSIDFSQNIGGLGEWYLKDVKLGKLNLIAGKNAVGKSRAVSILTNLVNMINGKLPFLLDGNWKLTFREDRKTVTYVLRVKDKKVVEEEIIQGRRRLLVRKGEEGKIFSVSNNGGGYDNYSPPANKLTNQVRRDVRQYPFVEQLATWAENYHFISFSTISPNMMGIMVGDMKIGAIEYISPELGMVAFLLKQIQEDTNIMSRIIKDLKKIGCGIKGLESTELAGQMAQIREFERFLDFPVPQREISQGMFRVIAIVITLNYLMNKTRTGTIVIDDLCEGLDFSRSSRLASLLFERLEKSDVQLIVTTNDEFLMSAVDVKYWNILERVGKHVKSYNYENSKKAFDEFSFTGMNNFDFFASKLYKRLKDD